MKRKDYQDKYEDFNNLNFSSSSSKSRRLNPEAFPYISEEVPVSCTDSEIFEPSQQQERRSEPINDDFVPTNDERAIVLYNPQTNPTLYRSPTAPSFSDFSSLVVDADLIPSLKEQLLSLEKMPSKNRSMEMEDTNNNMAMVPWVARQAGAVGPLPEPVEDSGEVEMMDVENDGSVPAPGLQQYWQQQHWLRPEVFYSNTSFSPVSL